MSTIRVNKREGYFVASNEPFNDSGLSWGARGVMGYLLSKPNHWELCNKDLENQYAGRGGGREAVENIIAELKRAGYVSRVAMRRDDGTIYYQTQVYETKGMNPHYSAEPSTDSPSTGLPYTVEPLPVNPQLVITEEANTELENRKEEEAPPAVASSSFLNGRAAAAAVPKDLGEKDENYQQKYWVLRAAGVGSKKFVEILNRNDLSADFVRGHFEAKQDNQTTGLIIHKILDGDPVPQNDDDGDYVPEEYRHIVKR